jgi:outer membrane lipoprotein-sorting protein
VGEPGSIYLRIVFQMMKKSCVILSLGILAPALTGCISSTRYVKVHAAPPIVMSTSVDDLVKRVDTQFEAIKTLNASVTIATSVAGATAGEVKDYSAFRGYIFVRKPEEMRVILMVPLLGRALDMVSTGKDFTLLMMLPSKTRAIKGTDTVSTPSKNALENLRPGVFFDALLVRSIGPDEYVTMTESTRLAEPETKKHDAVYEPDYDLSVLKMGSGHTMQRLRTIHISRTDLQPYQQDIYNESGKIVTTVQYSKYQTFGDLQFPTEIAIDRPLDKYSLKVVVQKLTANQKIEDDQFELQLPAGVTVETLK